MMKYELIELTKENKFYGTGVKYQIKALKGFSNVKRGHLGGYVNNKNNLSQDGNCWIYGEGIVCDNGRVCENGIVSNNGIVSDRGRVCGNGRVYGNGRVSGNGIVSGNTRIERDYICTTPLYYPKLYSYVSFPIFDTKSQKPTHIRMGCFIRTIKEWQEDFYNNKKEFPKGEQQTKQRLLALNYILMSLGEEIIYLED